MSNQFRGAYALGRGIIEPHKSLEDRFKDFDTMIEQVKADAWEEGAEALEHHQMHVSGGWPTNPYRRQEEA